jgi:hypothetical protein
MAEDRRLASIERAQWVILGLFTVGSLLFWDWRITLGVVFGGGIVILNFKALRMIFASGFSQERITASVFVKYAVKSLAVLAAVGAVVILLRSAVNLMAFLVGLLTVFLAIVVEGVRGHQYKGKEESGDGA